MRVFATIASGRERWHGGACVPRHRHESAYAAIVLSGAYEECGNQGRFLVGAGDVLFHAAFDGHLDRFQRDGAQILNILVEAPGFSIGAIVDPDAIVRLAETDPVAASALLRAEVREKEPAKVDWPDILAADLIGDPDCRLDGWARSHRLNPETLSRGFGRLFGIAPAAFRLEVRTRRALVLIRETQAPLAAIALQAGFADQAHMSRAVRGLTGRPPQDWRKSNPFKTVQSYHH